MQVNTSLPGLGGFAYQFDHNHVGTTLHILLVPLPRRRSHEEIRHHIKRYIEALAKALGNLEPEKRDALVEAADAYRHKRRGMNGTKKRRPMNGGGGGEMKQKEEKNEESPALYSAIRDITQIRDAERAAEAITGAQPLLSAYHQSEKQRLAGEFPARYAANRAQFGLQAEYALYKFVKNATTLEGRGGAPGQKALFAWLEKLRKRIADTAAKNLAAQKLDFLKDESGKIMLQPYMEFGSWAVGVDILEKSKNSEQTVITALEEEVRKIVERVSTDALIQKRAFEQIAALLRRFESDSVRQLAAALTRPKAVSVPAQAMPNLHVPSQALPPALFPQMTGDNRVDHAGSIAAARSLLGVLADPKVSAWLDDQDKPLYTERQIAKQMITAMKKELEGYSKTGPGMRMFPVKPETLNAVQRVLEDEASDFLLIQVRALQAALYSAMIGRVPHSEAPSKLLADKANMARDALIKSIRHCANQTTKEGATQAIARLELRADEDIEATIAHIESRVDARLVLCIPILDLLVRVDQTLDHHRLQQNEGTKALGEFRNNLIEKTKTTMKSLDWAPRALDEVLPHLYNRACADYARFILFCEAAVDSDASNRPLDKHLVRVKEKLNTLLQRFNYPEKVKQQIVESSSAALEKGKPNADRLQALQRALIAVSENQAVTSIAAAVETWSKAADLTEYGEKAKLFTNAYHEAIETKRVQLRDAGFGDFHNSLDFIAKGYALEEAHIAMARRIPQGTFNEMILNHYRQLQEEESRAAYVYLEEYESTYLEALQNSTQKRSLTGEEDFKKGLPRIMVFIAAIYLELKACVILTSRGTPKRATEITQHWFNDDKMHIIGDLKPWISLPVLRMIAAMHSETKRRDIKKALYDLFIDIKIQANLRVATDSPGYREIERVTKEIESVASQQQPKKKKKKVASGGRESLMGLPTIDEEPDGTYAILPSQEISSEMPEPIELNDDEFVAFIDQDRVSGSYEQRDFDQESYSDDSDMEPSRPPSPTGAREYQEMLQFDTGTVFFTDRDYTKHITNVEKRMKEDPEWAKLTLDEAEILSRPINWVLLPFCSMGGRAAPIIAHTNHISGHYGSDWVVRLALFSCVCLCVCLSLLVCLRVSLKH